MPLMIDTGHATLAGLRERNEDFVGMVTPHEPELSAKGLLAAIADGVSGNDGGREASEYAVRGLLADYYATPDTWPVTQALDRVIKATNSWVQHQGAIRRELAGMATTLTAVVLRGGFYYFAHVGDTRIYLLRNGALTRLTTDHVWDRPEMHHVLTRAIGLDSRLAIDHGMGELQVRDVFLLATDGMWASLAEHEIAALLADVATGKCAAADCADGLTNAALAAGSSDNISALVLKIHALPEENLRDALSASQQLPFPPKLKVGQAIDGYLVDALIHESKTTMLYRVIDPKSQRRLVLKTLHPDHANDAQERSAFAHEEWLAKKVVARFFPQVIMPEQRSFLYYLTTWHQGHTLQQRLDAGEHFTIPDAIAHASKLVRAIGALHRRSIIHRDIKPGNVHLGDDGELRILDLGVAQSGLDHDVDTTPMAGTPSFLAPEQFDHEPPSPQSDIYAAGVTIYMMLTRRYPYGEIEPFQRPRFGEPAPPSRYRPDLPHWLENVLLKAVARDRVDRFETAEEFLLALERGASRPLAPPPSPSLAKRNPLALWQAIAVILFITNLLMLYLMTIS
ncbi:MAG: serine/threonine protein phosphatase [Burkholderiales bacterium RIFCSPLOWO2_02_FULL_57_36]|nr:MAG: serine/threonine protein phosphatase [Burkholderiales bacterium RIFCSPLOWO2_02_FULL_57_36]